MKDLSNVTLEDATIRFRNFSGKEGKYNREGDRNFCVFLDRGVADQLVKDGWNIKQLTPREEGDEPQAYLQVTVGYGKGRPPRVVLVTSRGKNDLGEGEVSMMDWVEVKHVDMIIRPYQWEVNEKTGVKAYLKSIFITMVEDELDLKYADVPDSAQNTLVKDEEWFEDEETHRGPRFE